MSNDIDAAYQELSAPPRLPQALLMLLRCALFPSAVEEAGAFHQETCLLRITVVCW